MEDLPPPPGELTATRLGEGSKSMEKAVNSSIFTVLRRHIQSIAQHVLLTARQPSADASGPEKKTYHVFPEGKLFRQLCQLLHQLLLGRSPQSSTGTNLLFRGSSSDTSTQYA